MQWSELPISTFDARVFDAAWIPPTGGRRQRIIYAISRSRRVGVYELQPVGAGFALLAPPELGGDNVMDGEAAAPKLLWIEDEVRRRMQLRLHATVQAGSGLWPIRYIDLPFFKPLEYAR